MDVLRQPERWVGYCSVRSIELPPRNGGDQGPEILGSVQIETLMEVHANAQSRLVNLEIPTQPSTEHTHHRRIRVGEVNVAVPLSSLARIQGCAGDQERLLREN